MALGAHEPAERENVGRIDHVILIYRNRENRENARQQFSALLGIDDWDDLGEAEEGIHIVISWKSGIELICPTREIPAFEHHLAKYGEGFYGMVFGVADLDKATAHVAEKGGGTPRPLGAPPAAVFRKFDQVREAVVGKVGGIRLLLGEFKRKA